MEYVPLFETADVLPKLLYSAYYQGADELSDSSNPCSWCKNLAAGYSLSKPHFHGSDLGGCQLRIYWNKLNNLKVDNANRNNFLMDGHTHEKTILDYIAASGIPYDLYPCENGKEYVKDFGNFVVVGHPDAFLARKVENGDMYALADPIYIVECKAVSDATYKKCKDNFLSDIWYGQLQSYMEIVREVDTSYLIVKHRASSDILMPFRIEYNAEYVQRRLTGLRHISDVLTSPNTLESSWTVDTFKEHKSSKDAECSVCPFFNKCWGKK